jgi:hypothetical protein
MLQSPPFGCVILIPLVKIRPKDMGQSIVLLGTCRGIHWELGEHVWDVLWMKYNETIVFDWLAITMTQVSTIDI